MFALVLFASTSMLFFWSPVASELLRCRDPRALVLLPDSGLQSCSLSLCLCREVLEKDAKDYADSIHAIFVETSAKNAININELFLEISEYSNMFLLLQLQL